MPAQREEVSHRLVDELLSLPTREERAGYLRKAGLLDVRGLDRLLDVAEHLLGEDPGKARLLAELCAGIAGEAGAPAAVPRASYIRAGAHSLNGEFEEDLRLTKAAHDGYVALGMNLEALRTNVGKMAALLELGRYGEALEAGRTVLDALDGKSELEALPSERDLLVALVHQNLGGCYEYMGRYDEALEAYTIAESHYRDLGIEERLADVVTNRGAVLARLGRGSEALAAHETAAAIYEKAGLLVGRTVALHNAGETYVLLGDYARGLKAFEQVRRLYRTHEASAHEHLLVLDMADAYLALNLYPEALAAYREANRLLSDLGMAHDRARALWGMGAALSARSEFEEAESALSEAATLFEEAGNLALLSGVMLEQASLLAAGGEREVALATARRALELVAGDDWPVQRAYAHLRVADLTLPDLAGAEPHLIEAERLANRLALPQLRYRSRERLGHLRRLQGRQEEARTLLEAAVEEIERLRGSVAQDVMRASFLRDKIAAYEDLLQLRLSRSVEEGARPAFSVAERAKSRALVDLLAGVVQAGLNPDDPTLEGRLNELQADLNATYGRMLSAPVDGETVPDLRRRAAGLEAEISRLRLQAASSSAAVPNLFAGSGIPAGTEELLPADAVLLAYHISGGDITAFIGAGKDVRVARHPGAAARVRRLSQRLAVQWDRFRAGRQFAGRHLRLLERSARQVLSSLYEELVAPLEPLLDAAVGMVPGDDPMPRLAVVPHGPLHQIPFHALFDGERYLVERFEISYAPSATVYALCQRRIRRESGRALVFGVEDPLIPAAVDEACAIAGRLPDAKLYVGEAATVAALRERTTGSRLLHLASHGLFRADNPMFSALKLHDGWLTAAEVMDLNLDGALVVLSACESGRSEVVGGDEILGLTRAFLGAGAATLVVSLWLVQDETTAHLMRRWYEMLGGGMEPAAALRAAQLEIKDIEPHPFLWAPFVLIGKR